MKNPSDLLEFAMKSFLSFAIISSIVIASPFILTLLFVESFVRDFKLKT